MGTIKNCVDSILWLQTGDDIEIVVIGGEGG